MTDWYNELEPEIRDLVKLLRNNGWNTTSSCGHKMYIEIEINKLNQAEELATFLVENLFKDFWIETFLEVPFNSYWRRALTLHIGCRKPEIINN